MEHWFLDRFLKKEGLSTDFHPEYVEKPDFIITIDGIRIGVEVTEFFFSDVIPGAGHKFQIDRENAIEKARQRFCANGGPALSVVPVFNDFPKPMGPKGNREIEDFAKRLERAVWRNGWPDEPPRSQVFRGGHTLPELDYYTVRACREGTDGPWCRAGPTHQEVLEAHHIQSALDRKACKYHSYIGDFNEVWLVIYTEGGLRDVPHEIGKDARNNVYDFPFDGAYWFDSFPYVETTRLRKL
jgi:hypothetical protein